MIEKGKELIVRPPDTPDTPEPPVPAKLGIIIGRMQPFHKGHERLLREARKNCNKVLLLLGGANRLPNYLNPFTYDERKDLVTKVFKESDKFIIRPLADSPSDDVWIADVIGHALSLTDDVDPTAIKVYTSDKDKDFYEDCFVFPVESLDSKELSATDIRCSLYRREPLSSLKVPEVTKVQLRNLMSRDHFSHMRDEFFLCVSSKAEAMLAHAFNNPIEPVAHAVLIQSGKVLLVKRNSKRGYGQWAIPGGFVESWETTQEAAIRELREETGIYVIGKRVAQVASCVEENKDDISTRTLGVNYLFAVADEEELEITIDPDEVLEYKWVPVMDICNEKEILFYNHNLVVQRLMSIAGSTQGNVGTQETGETT